MSADAGKMLELLENAEVWNLYASSIRKMQPVDLVRRLESEKLSTRGHMSELRARLLRLEVRKSQPRIDVPWYPEDESDKSNENFPGTSSQDVDRAMAKLMGVWVSDARDDDGAKETSCGKTKIARLRQRQNPFFGGKVPMCSGLFTDLDKKGKGRGQMNGEAWHHQRYLEDQQRSIDKLESDLKKILAFKSGNYDTSVQDQHASKSLETEKSSATGASATPSQQQAAKTSNEPTPSTSYSTSYDKEVTYTARKSTKPYTEFGRPFVNEDFDDDPFEHVDSSDWIDDYIE